MTPTLSPPKSQAPPTDRISIASQSTTSPSPSPGSRLWDWTQFLLCLVLTAGLLVYLIWTPDPATPAATDHPQPEPEDAVRVAAPQRICIQPDCPLSHKLQVAIVKPVKITAPVLTVTGMVAASLRPGNGRGPDYWQFSSPELLAAFTDWQKATADIAFAQTQLAQIKLLAETRVNAQQQLVERMQKLVEAGTDPLKDLAAAQADLIQSQITGRKEVYEAETALRLAERTEAAMARQLQQAGLDPELLQAAASDLDVVAADVPEGLMARVRIGQGCEARFFGFPDQVFTGKVRAIAPVLSKERRSLRVLFAISDPQDQLRPGMFADIGLGTDARDALLVPPEGIVHVGRSDYVLVKESDDDGERGEPPHAEKNERRRAPLVWRVTEVKVGELHDAGVEIVGGLGPGNQIAGQGVILLKPYIIEALRARPATTSPQPQSTLAGDRR